MFTLKDYATSALGLDLTLDQARSFDRLTELLLAWNARMNLTAITDPQAIAIMHYLDALTLTKVVSSFDDLRLVDVGSGAGFPGLPLAIAYPQLEVTLLDSRAKSCASSVMPAPNLG